MTLFNAAAQLWHCAIRASRSVFGQRMTAARDFAAIRKKRATSALTALRRHPPTNYSLRCSFCIAAISARRSKESARMTEVPLDVQPKLVVTAHSGPPASYQLPQCSLRIAAIHAPRSIFAGSMAAERDESADRPAQSNGSYLLIVTAAKRSTGGGLSFTAKANARPDNPENGHRSFVVAIRILEVCYAE